MPGDAGLVRFIGEGDRFYQLITDMEEVIGLWEEIAYIAENNEVDYETIFEMPADGRVFKVIFGPPFTIVFQNADDGLLVIYSIRRPSF